MTRVLKRNFKIEYASCCCNTRIILKFTKRYSPRLAIIVIYTVFIFRIFIRVIITVQTIVFREQRSRRIHFCLFLVRLPRT